jgi:2-dehydro-3-deoxygluconokinase
MGSYDIVAIGEPLYELVQQDDGRFIGGFGGDTSNMLVAAARLGARCAYVTAIGNDAFGDALLELWRSEGIDCRYVRRREDAPTGAYIISSGALGPSFTYLRKGSAASLISAADISDEAIRSAGFVHASGISLAISSSAAKAVESAFARARGFGIRTSFDANVRLKLWPLDVARASIHTAASEVDVLKISLDDAQLLCGLSDSHAIAHFYRDLGAGCVAVTLGANGAVMADNTSIHEIPGVDVSCIDATGAGDAFMGALLASLCAGKSAAQTLRMANLVGALSTTGRGAISELPRLDSVQESPILF